MWLPQPEVGCNTGSARKVPPSCLELAGECFSDRAGLPTLRAVLSTDDKDKQMNAPQITQNTGLSIRPETFDQAMRMADILAKSAFIPAQYRGKSEDVLVAMMMGVEIGLHPIQSLQNIAVINGKPSIYGDAMIALVQSHHSFESIQESFDDSTMTAVCKVKRKGVPQHTVRFSQEDATSAGLWGKTGPWKQYPKRMLQMRARGFALRDQFADALMGLISAEEAQDYAATQEVEKDITPPKQESQPELPEIPDQRFDDLLPKYAALINGGKPADEIIAQLETKYKLSQEQKKMIMEC